MNTQYDQIFQDAADRWGIPFEWIKAIAATESSFDSTAIRPEPRINDASYGLMQILTSTARGLGWRGTDPKDLLDPWVNVNLGAKLIAQLKAAYGSFERVYSAYNSGKPDRYLTSSEVATNVNRALDWLNRVITDIGESLPGSPSPETTVSIAGILLAGIAAYFIMR